MQSQTTPHIERNFPAPVFFRPAAACHYLGMSRTKLHELSEYDADFPRKVRISIRCVGWTKDQLDNWLAKKVGEASGQ